MPSDADDRKINISYGTKHRITGKNERKYQNFNYHVAIIMPVKDLHGSVKDLVFDPVLFDGPADPIQWAEELHADCNENTICTLNKKPYPSVITSYSIHYTKLYESDCSSLLSFSSSSDNSLSSLI